MYVVECIARGRLATEFGDVGKKYYLVNGWNKYRTFFTGKISNANYFKTLTSAKAMITKIKKVGLDNELGYDEDEYRIIEVA